MTPRITQMLSGLHDWYLVGPDKNIMLEVFQALYIT